MIINPNLLGILLAFNIGLSTFLLSRAHWLIEIIRIFFFLLLIARVIFFLVVRLLDFWSWWFLGHRILLNWITNFLSFIRTLILLRGHSFKLFVWIFIIIFRVLFFILTLIILLLLGCNRLRILIIIILIYRINLIGRQSLLINWHRWCERHNANGGSILASSLQILWRISKIIFLIFLRLVST